MFGLFLFVCLFVVVVVFVVLLLVFLLGLFFFCFFLFFFGGGLFAGGFVGKLLKLKHPGLAGTAQKKKLVQKHWLKSNQGHVWAT